jgi:hypothetical protein
MPGHMVRRTADIIRPEASTTILSELLSVNVRSLSGTVSLEGSLLSRKVRLRPVSLFTKNATEALKMRLER